MKFSSLLMSRFMGFTLTTNIVKWIVHRNMDDLWRNMQRKFWSCTMKRAGMTNLSSTSFGAEWTTCVVRPDAVVGGGPLSPLLTSSAMLCECMDPHRGSH